MTSFIGNANNFCYQTANIWQVVGYFLSWFKIIIPILLIVFGMIDFGKAIVASKNDEIKKATSSLIKRIIAAITIFFLPTIIVMVFNLLEGTDNWKPCLTCIENPSDSACVNYQYCVDNINSLKCQNTKYIYENKK